MNEGTHIKSSVESNLNQKVMWHATFCPERPGRWINWQWIPPWCAQSGNGIQNQNGLVKCNALTRSFGHVFPNLPLDLWHSNRIHKTRDWAQGIWCRAQDVNGLSGEVRSGEEREASEEPPNWYPALRSNPQFCWVKSRRRNNTSFLKGLVFAGRHCLLSLDYKTCIYGVHVSTIPLSPAPLSFEFWSVFPHSCSPIVHLTSFDLIILDDVPCLRFGLWHAWSRFSIARFFVFGSYQFIQRRRTRGSHNRRRNRPV